MDPKEEIRARLPIEQLVAQYCQLKKKGRNYVCLCPFHNDSHPSLLVSPDKGLAYCFACQSGGDIFAFFQKIEGVDFPTAIKMLAEKAGVELPKERRGERASVTVDEKERIRQCLEAAADFYAAQLKSSVEASAYAARRGVTDELLKMFQIGFSPDSFTATYDYLLKAGFSRSEIISAGLGVQKELTDERIYDRFRNRIMFPITDNQGRIIGFGGRTLGQSDAKYVNSPDGPLYHKSSVLFGLYQARDAIRAKKTVLLVEGYFDVIAAHKAGVQNVVAVSGTALTEEHARILKRYADTVILCLDQDQAGRTAATRAFQLLAPAQIAVQSVTIPAKDPDELVQSDPSALARFIGTATAYIDSVLAEMALLPDVREPSKRSATLAQLFPLLSVLPTSVELRSYIEKAARTLGMVENELNRDFLDWKRTAGTAPRLSTGAPTAPQKDQFSKSEISIGVACLYPKHRGLLKELIPLHDERLEAVRQSLLALDETVDDVFAALQCDSETKERLKLVTLYCEEDFPEWSDTMAEREIRKICRIANEELLHRKQVEIVGELRKAKSAQRIDDESMLLTKSKQVHKLTKMASGKAE